MYTFNVRQAVEQSLRLLKQGGTSEKTVDAYRTVGFDTIIQYFARQGALDVTTEMLDAFILAQRKLFDQGKFLEWKWRLLRRAGELLKHYVKTGKVEMPPLRPWEPVIQKPRQSVEIDTPTSEQLADPNDLFALIWRVKQELHSMGLAKLSIRHYTTEGLTVILRKHTSRGLTHYSELLVSEMVSEKRIKYEKRQTSRNSYQNLRKAGFLLSEMYRTGRITLSKLPIWGKREPAPAFGSLLGHFCDSTSRSGIFTMSTIKTAKSAIRSFFFELEMRGFKSFNDITLAEINKSITHIATRYTGGLHAAIFSVRVFLKHLYENDFTSEDLSLAIPGMVARRNVFREGFTDAEIARLLEMPDLETPIGKRDYAIMLLAAQTGLRACDIVNLKREDIEWRAKEIRIMQQKTGKPLSLPLEPDSGNAIVDYLLYARPESDLPYVFLCNTGVLRPINNRSASTIVTKYLKRAGIVSIIPRRGFHSFRRSFGTRLLKNEIPLELLRQLLGHSKIDSAKPYLSVDEQGLKNCALGLVATVKDGDLS